MKLLTEKPFGLKENFICMGIVLDSGKAYACLLQTKTGSQYVEEIHWGIGQNIETATLHQIENDEEWSAVLKFITNTTIFSPRKIKKIMQSPALYFYSSEYKKTMDYLERKEKGIL